MAIKSQARIDVDQALINAGVEIGRIVFNDKNKTCRRFKFSQVNATAAQQKQIQQTLSEKYNNVVVKKSDKFTKYQSYYAGLTVKIDL